MSELKKNEISTVTEQGSINYASDVVAVIAGLAASEIAGVAGMSGSSITELLGRKNLTKGVKVTVDGENVSLDLSITVLYGNQIHKVAANVQENVTKAITNMTGLNVTNVNVFVSAIQFEKETVAAAAASAEAEEDDEV